MCYFERAAARTAKCATRVIAMRRDEIARSSPRMRESRELVVVEQIGRHAGAAIAAVEVPARPGRSDRTRAARRHSAELLADSQFMRADPAREILLLVIHATRDLVL